jgi:hypothetical protein
VEGSAYPDSGVLVAEMQDDLIAWIREYSGARRDATAAGEA